MARKTRKAKQKAQVGWYELISSLCWMIRALWRIFCFLCYLNPCFCCCRRRRKHRTDGNAQTFSPSAWERFLINMRSDATNSRMLLDWAQEQIPTFRLNDFSTAWNDGVALCALLESVCPGCCPRYNLLKPINKVNNCRLGLKLAYRFLNIPQTIITPEEMASGTELQSSQVHNLIQHIKWHATSDRIPVAEKDWFRVSRPVRAQDGTIIRATEPCLAKGGGLVNGLVSKRSKFNIFTEQSVNICVEIEIKGPNNHMCIQTIKSEDVVNKSLEGQKSQGFRGRLSMGHSLWTSLSDNLFSRGEKWREGLVRQGRINVEKFTRRNRIPIDYQTLNNTHYLISYVPISAGIHVITIKWHGEHIPGSPFNVQVAASFDLLQKKVPAQKKAKVATFPEISEKVQTSESGTGSWESEPQVTAAVLSHTSTVHRSLSKNYTLNPRAAQLQKQVTITRKRVLRKVFTRGGEEIVIDTAASTSSEETQDGNHKIHVSEGSPAPVSGALAFDTFTDSSNTSRSLSPQTSIINIREETSNVLIDNSQKQLKTRENQSKMGKSNKTGYNRSYSTDDILPSSNQRAHLLNTPRPELHTRESPNIHRHLSHPDDRSPWAWEGIDHASIKEKLLEGGFITQMPSIPRDKFESDSTLDSDSDIVSQRGRDMTTESSDHTSGESLGTNSGLVQTKKGNYRYRQKLRKQGEQTWTTPAALTKPNDKPVSQKDLSELDKKSNDENNEKVQQDTSMSSEIMAKKPLGKTFSDPCKTQKHLPPQRSSTVSEISSIERDYNSPIVKILQSESLNKTCFYISQKAITESLQSPSFNISTNDFMSSSSSDQKDEDETPQYGNKTESELKSPETSDSGRADMSNQVPTTNIKTTRTNQLANTKAPRHRNLQQSLSLPTLSKSWKAFEIDPDDDVQSLEEAEALVNARMKTKRATLGAEDLRKQLQNFNRLKQGSQESITSKEDFFIPAVTKPYFEKICSPLDDDTCNDSENETKMHIKFQSKRRASLQKQVICHASSSESSTDTKRGFQEEYRNQYAMTEASSGMKTCMEAIVKQTYTTINSNLRLGEHKRTHKINQKSDKCQIQSPKQDMCTQVSYTEIKTETGWKHHIKLAKKKKKIISKKYGEKEELVMGKLKSSNNKVPSKDFKEFSNGHVSTQVASLRFTPQKSQIRNQSSINESTSTSQMKNGMQVKISACQSEGSRTGKPVRQSTVDTVDSGIVDENNQAGNYAIFRPRFIMGHRVLHRRPNRRRVPIDPKFLGITSSSSSHEEDKTAAKDLLVNSGNAKLSISGLVHAVQRFTRGTGRSATNRPKISSHRRRVLFSRRIMVHRRSSSRSSRSTEKNARSTDRSKFQTEQPVNAEGRNPLLNVCDEHGSRESSAVQNQSNVEQKEEDIKKWVINCSENQDADLSTDNIDVGISVTHVGPVQDDVPVNVRTEQDPAFLLAASRDYAPSEYSDHLSQAGSTDDPDYCGFGISPGLRRGLLDELNMFSNITPEKAPSRQDSMTDVDNTHINQSWEDDFDVQTSLELAVWNSVDPEMPRSPRSPVSRPGEEDTLGEIRTFLERALSLASQQPENQEIRLIPGEVVPDGTSVPNAEACIAQGVGLAEGTVGIRNNFQVATADAGNGNLTVGINGPRPHTVTETNVTYTGDNLYDVIYDVTQPGYYTINIRWSDISIPGSPFISKVSY